MNPDWRNYAVLLSVVQVIVGQIKPLLEASVLPPTAKLHDPLLRWLSLGVAIVAAAVLYLAQTPAVSLSGLLTAAGFGAGAALAANGVYIFGQGGWNEPKTATTGVLPPQGADVALPPLFVGGLPGLPPVDAQVDPTAGAARGTVQTVPPMPGA